MCVCCDRKPLCYSPFRFAIVKPKVSAQKQSIASFKHCYLTNTITLYRCKRKWMPMSTNEIIMLPLSLSLSLGFRQPTDTRYMLYGLQMLDKLLYDYYWFQGWTLDIAYSFILCLLRFARSENVIHGMNYSTQRLTRRRRNVVHFTVATKTPGRERMCIRYGCIYLNYVLANEK